MAKVSVPNDYFLKSALRDYSSPFRALIRELLQNSRDAKATQVDITYDGVTLTCSDDGHGMTRDVIENKLMALGESTKGDGETGGFGIAKILLFLAHPSYTIRTGNLIVRGQGGEYSIEEHEDSIKGVCVTIQLAKEIRPHTPGTDVSELTKDIIRETRLSNLKMKVNVNGIVSPSNLRAGRRVADLGSGVTIHRTKLDKGQSHSYALVRVRGLHMFHLYVGPSNYYYVVELSGYSKEILTSNRDGFRNGWDTRINKTCQALVSNSQLAIESKQYNFRGRSAYQSSAFSFEPAVKKLNALLKSHLEEAGEATEDTDPDSNDSPVAKEAVMQAVTATLSQERLAPEVMQALMSRASEIINAGRFDEIKLDKHYNVYTQGFRKLPKAWEPESLNDWKKELLALWSAIVGRTLVLAGHKNAEFEVGFAVYHEKEEDRALAMYAKHSGKHIFYLNPKRYGDETMLPIFNKKRRAELILWLMNLAAHEVTHFLGNMGHNEDFVIEEAALMQKMILNLREFLALTGKKVLVLPLQMDKEEPE
jgi:hypothetical protein